MCSTTHPRSHLVLCTAHRWIAPWTTPPTSATSSAASRARALTPPARPQSSQCPSIWSPTAGLSGWGRITQCTRTWPASIRPWNWWTCPPKTPTPCPWSSSFAGASLAMVRTARIAPASRKWQPGEGSSSSSTCLPGSITPPAPSTLPTTQCKSTSFSSSPDYSVESALSSTPFKSPRSLLIWPPGLKVVSSTCSPTSQSSTSAMSRLRTPSSWPPSPSSYTPSLLSLRFSIKLWSTESRSGAPLPASLWAFSGFAAWPTIKTSSCRETPPGAISIRPSKTNSKEWSK